MAEYTITEALAELRTLEKRITKKNEFIAPNLVRVEAMRDPLEKDGGQVTVIARELQAYHDLCQRRVAIRAAIRRANENTVVVVGGEARTVADWLVWRRETAPRLQSLYGSMRSGIERVRRDVQQRGNSMVPAGQPANPTDVIVNISEKSLAEWTEALEETLGKLDGLLSLKNATTMVEVA